MELADWERVAKRKNQGQNEVGIKATPHSPMLSQFNYRAPVYLIKLAGTHVRELCKTYPGSQY